MTNVDQAAASLAQVKAAQARGQAAADQHMSDGADVLATEGSDIGIEQPQLVDDLAVPDPRAGHAASDAAKPVSTP
jgi:hypothetical protein